MPFLSGLESSETPKPLTLLTTTEKEGIKLIAQNKTAKEIGKLMLISSRTIEKHKNHIINKLELKSKASSLFWTPRKTKTI
ncbi:MAG TPA: LuxR C-terminal-related transcriptional regulator [Flavobacteriaceae bacterium]|nr:LuxR C-terminal-related transcriptional regulator [Flavobacteriaceae bacterium]